MAKNPMTIAQFATLINPAVNKYFFDTLEEEKPDLSALVKERTQAEYTYTEQNLAGLGRLEAVSEGKPYKKDGFIEAYSTTFTPTKYMGGIEISYETKKFERMDLVSKVPSEEARAANRTKEALVMEIYNRSTDSTFTSYGDAMPLGSVQHPKADGTGNLSNASASGVAYSEVSQETAMLAMEEATSDRGNVLRIFADTLWGPAALRKQFIVVNKSTGKPGTANNDANAYNSTINKLEGGTIPNILVVRNLGAFAGGSNTRWGLLDSNNHRIYFITVDDIKVEQDNSIGFANDMMNWKVRAMWTRGWGDWRGFWVSNGDGQVYSA